MRCGIEQASYLSEEGFPKILNSLDFEQYENSVQIRWNRQSEVSIFYQN